MPKLLIGLLTTVLWLLSVALGIYLIVPLRDTLLLLYAWIVSAGDPGALQRQNSYWSAVFISQVLVVLLGLMVGGLAVATGEYHAKHGGERSSWRLLGWTLGSELLLLLVTLPFG